MDLKLIEAESKKKGIATDKLLEQQANAKVADPTDAEVYAFYLGQTNQQNQSDGVRAQDERLVEQAKLNKPAGIFMRNCARSRKLLCRFTCRSTWVGFFFDMAGDLRDWDEHGCFDGNRRTK